jgi:hypothetical protein
MGNPRPGTPEITRTKSKNNPTILFILDDHAENAGGGEGDEMGMETRGGEINLTVREESTVIET